MNDDILYFIYDARSEELAILNDKDKEFLNSPKTDFDKTYKEFLSLLEELPEGLRIGLLDKYNICIDTKDLIHAYFYKKYYKMGFSECMKLIFDCINL